MINFQIATPERVVYKQEIDSVSLPTPMGEITVLPNHLPLVSLISPGMITVRQGKQEQYMAISGGFIAVKPQSQVTVLADSAEKAEELTLAEIEKARERAKKLLTETRVADEESFVAAAAGLERELARLRVARKHRARGGLKIEIKE